MQDLADCIGLRKASLYTRFPNKEALVAEVLNLTLQDIFTRDDPDVPWDVAYETVVRSIADSLADRKRCVGLHLAYGVDDETPFAKEAVKAFFQFYRDRLSDILTRAMPRETAEILASDALIRLEGATLLVTVFNEKNTMDRVVRSIMLDSRNALATPLLR